MGLISAARKVAAATQGLCESANALVQGHASQERLVSSAKQVAACTAQLLVACKVKADIFSEGMKRLQVSLNSIHFLSFPSSGECGRNKSERRSFDCLENSL